MRRVAVTILVMALGGLLFSAPPSPAPAPPQAKTRNPATLADALRVATPMGPAGPTTEVHLNFGLTARNPQLLRSVMTRGERLTPAEYEANFGPNQNLLNGALRTIRRAGLAAERPPQSQLIAVDGPAPAAAALLGIDFENYRLPDGTAFYAAGGRPALPPSIAAVASDVEGLDSFASMKPAAVTPGGLAPVDVSSFYDLRTLVNSGLDGSGETILLPEIDNVPNFRDLDAFATEFGLPRYEGILTIKRNQSWGNPASPQGEAAMDLEVIHGIAPKAKLVVYESSSNFAATDRAFDQMVSDHLGSIISESLGACEFDTPASSRDQYASIEDRAVALGMTHFVASGDSGAYTCGQDHPAVVDFPASLPTVTAVGGTTAFQAADGSYSKETAWGSAIDQSGSGGGNSAYYDAPDFQQVVSNVSGADGRRQVPDVAADSDPVTGFHILFQGEDTQAGGTSAAAPVWAGIAALINQDLKEKGLREIGFANPAIYWMGANADKFSVRPFHDVTIGNNLLYDATPGWDFATGWGTPDGRGLDAAWIKYIQDNGA